MGVSENLAFQWDDVPRPGQRLMDEDRDRFVRAEAAGGGEVSVRWFRWDRPTLSLGHAQDPARTVDGALCAADGVPVVVRPTGGRAVFHVDEWTYSAVVPLAHPAFGGSLADSCRALVEVVAEALEQAFGVRADGAGPRGPRGPAARPGGTGDVRERAACFGRSFGHELTVGGRKLMGSAQRRGRHALLQQGSLLVGPGQEQVLRYLRGAPGGDGNERTDRQGEAALAELRAGSTHLAELLGRRPDAARFVPAFEAALERLANPVARLS
jgi:lipoate-protein ligase A